MLRAQTRRFASSVSGRNNDFTHCVVGGGVVGLAIARQLARRGDGTNTVLLERHGAVGTETSSRNSEVIHAGLYYPPKSLKTELCIKGAAMLYELCEKHHIPHRRTGKLILAQDEAQLATLAGVCAHAEALGIQTVWFTPEAVDRFEPAAVARAGALYSPRTGIVDSHALLQHLRFAFEDAGGDVALASSVRAITPLAGGARGYRILAATTPPPPPPSKKDAGGEETTEITADVVVNAAGLGAVAISNMVLPQHRHLTAYFCKGTYFSYSAPRPAVRTLLYPAPVAGLGGLGTHLTLDIAGRIRFGPDVEWVGDPRDLAPSAARMAAAARAIKTYLPGIDESALAPDYCGIRPKIAPEARGGVGQLDFVVREEEGFPGFVNLLGIESPGLTSSLAIAEMVEGILYR